MDKLSRNLSTIALIALTGFIIYFFIDRAGYSKKMQAKIDAIERNRQKLEKEVDSIEVKTQVRDAELRAVLKEQIETIGTITSTIGDASARQVKIREAIKRYDQKLDSLFNK